VKVAKMITIEIENIWKSAKVLAVYEILMKGIKMNTLEIKGDWNIAKGKIKQKWARLTDDDLQYAEGEMDELIGNIYKRTGEDKEAIRTALTEMFSI
jgi:uncharacterized protein YjbJ (UPF0337 family)